MAANWKSPDRRQFIWPTAGVVLAAAVSMNPFYRPHVTLEAGIAVWVAAMILALVLAAHPITARIGSLIIGFSLAIPCFLRSTPLWRGLLMCCMAFPLVVVAVPLLAPPSTNYRQRMAYLFTWLGTREVKRRAHRFDLKALIHLLAATLVFCVSMTAVKATPAAGGWMFARWFMGGMMILALAEIVTAGHDLLTGMMGLSAPALMRSPALSKSVGEFWTKRWNPAASFLLFRTVFFAPLARRRFALALSAAFFASAVAHVLLPYMAMGRWGISLACGAFFLAQPFFIAAERAMNVRRWPTAAARAWTLIALAIASPLFVEPTLQLVEPSWAPSDDLLLSTLAILGFVVGLNLFYALGSLTALSD